MKIRLSSVTCPKGADKATKNQLATAFNLNPPEYLEYSLEEAIESIGTLGYSWGVGNNKTNQLCTETQVLALDMDDSMVEDEFLAKCAILGFAPTFTHQSANNTTTPFSRYRAIWVLDRSYPMSDAAYKDIISPLISHFSSDRSCKNISRLFFSTPNSIGYLCKDNIYTLEQVQSIAIQVCSTKRTQERVIQKVAELGDSLRSSLKESPETANFDTDFQGISDILEPSGPIFSRCELLRELSAGVTFKGDHLAKLGLASQLKQVRGAKALLSRVFVGEGKWSTSQLSWVWKHSETKLCHLSCPFYSSCSAAPSLISTLQLKPKQVWSYLTVSREKMQEVLKRELLSALAAKDGKIHIIGGQVSAGKSSSLIAALQSIDASHINIACDTHRLKEEFAAKLIANNITNFTKTLDIPKCVSDDDRALIKAAFSIGAYSEGDEIIAKYGAEGQDYIEQRKKWPSGLVITTHQKVLCQQERASIGRTSIFDEDIFTKIVSINSANVSDITRFSQYDPNITSFFSQFLDIAKQTRGTISEVSGTIDESYLFKSYSRFLKTNTCSSNILNFANASYWTNLYEDITKKKTEYILTSTIQNIPQGTVIILSATASESVYRRLFGDRVVYHAIPLASEEGERIQSCERSYSKSSVAHIAKPAHKIQQIVALLEELRPYVITHKSLSPRFNKQREEKLHFGACSGSNIIEGEDAVVFSKLHLPPTTIALYAKSLSSEWSESNIERSSINLELNGWNISTYTFNDALMRELDMWLVEAEQEQAIGRPRGLWNKQKTVIFSDIPARFSKMVSEDEAIRTLKTLGGK